MENRQNFEKAAKQIRKLSVAVFTLFLAMGGILVYIMADPTLAAFNPKTELTTVQETINADPDFDKIENGVHIRTGFVEGDGLMAVVNNCTNCHSAKLVTQNRMTAAGWQSTIKWMQETQNLWDLGQNEELIVAYLAKYYAPENKGRRENLTNIQWYELKN